jgi:hypothetical protein
LHCSSTIVVCLLMEALATRLLLADEVNKESPY